MRELNDLVPLYVPCRDAAIDDESKTLLVLTQSILSARSIDEVSKLAP